MTFRETSDAFEGDSFASVIMTSAGEREAHAVVEEDAEETPRAATEETYAPGLTKGEDPVRLYRKEIGKVPLLNAAQEVQIGRRIEVGQIALRRTLVAIPMAVEALLEVGDKLRRGEIAADDVIVLPEGGELEAKAIRPIVLAFERVRRLQRKIARLEESLSARRRSAAYRKSTATAIAAAREAIQDVVADMTLKPALIDDLVAQVRRRWEKISELDRSARRVHNTVATRELRLLEKRTGLPRNQLGPLLEQIGREPTPEELAQRTGVPAKKVRLILESSRKPLSLETPIGEDSELGDFLEDKSAGSPNESLLNQDLTTQVERALSMLSPKEKEILRLRFGIGEEGEHTLEEVGKRFEVTRERIRQIEAKALRKLRHPLRGRNLRAFIEN